MSAEATLSKIEKPQSLDEVVYRQIKDAILNVTLTPGMLLVETRLADELGVSRTPVRKALARLEQEGFVSAAPSKGYQVADILLKDIQQIYDLREILECHLVRETARNFTEEELSELDAALDAADDAFQKGDYAGFLSTNRLFHHAFDLKYGNQRISELLNVLDEHIYRNLMAVFRASDAGSFEAARFEEHRMVLDAIRAADIESAVSIMRNHMRRFDAE